MTRHLSPARMTRLLALAVCGLFLAGLASVAGETASRWAFGLVRQFVPPA